MSANILKIEKEYNMICKRLNEYEQQILADKLIWKNGALIRTALLIQRDIAGGIK